MSTIAFSTSVRTPEGRLFIHIDIGALAALGADPADGASLLATFSRHAPLLQDIARGRARRLHCGEVTVGAADIRRPALP